MFAKEKGKNIGTTKFTTTCPTREEFLGYFQTSYQPMKISMSTKQCGSLPNFNINNFLLWYNDS